MSDADCTPGREPRSIAASSCWFPFLKLMLWLKCYCRHFLLDWIPKGRTVRCAGADFSCSDSIHVADAIRRFLQLMASLSCCRQTARCCALNPSCCTQR